MRLNVAERKSMQKPTAASKRSVLAVLALKVFALVAVAFLCTQPVLAKEPQSQVSFTTEAGDAGKNEAERIRGVYVPTGQTVVLTVVYKTGMQTKYTYAYVSGSVVKDRVQTEEVFKPMPGGKGTYLLSETRFDVQSGQPLWKKLYRQDGSTESYDRFTATKIDRSLFALDGFTELERLSITRSPGNKDL